MKRMQEVVDFFVKPAVLLAKIESMSGHDGATKAINHNPLRRANFFSCGSNTIMKHPAMAMRSRKAMTRRREFGSRGVAKETITTPRSIHAWVGMIIRTV
jgi:hypothetical protein